MKLFTGEQIRKIDQYTILNEPVESSALMERAAAALCDKLCLKFGTDQRFLIFAGPGNNGGDGLALARLLNARGYLAEVFYVNLSDSQSSDWMKNRKRLENETYISLNIINDKAELPVIGQNDIVIDALFGTGLSRPVMGLGKDVIKHINGVDTIIVSVDIPSGLFGEDNSLNSGGAVVEADYTYSFEFPKIAFLFSENYKYTGEVEVLKIGLHPKAIIETASPYFLLQKEDIKPLLKIRKKFDHKGIYGHGLLIAGSVGKIGAAILSSMASLHTGLGLLTCRIPSSGYEILQSAVPEAMVEKGEDEKFISNCGNADQFTAVGIGPGLGTEPVTQGAVLQLLKSCKKPIVIDADALNILSLHKGWFNYLPENAILTPHLKEFERFAGVSGNSYERLIKQMEFSKNQKCIIILKGAYSSVSFPDGRVFFNSTGNPGMATAGAGDVLTGIILSLLAQGYSPEESSLAGPFIHGLAGDIAASKGSFESVIATDIINNIGYAFKEIRK